MASPSPSSIPPMSSTGPPAHSRETFFRSPRTPIRGGVTVASSAPRDMSQSQSQSPAPARASQPPDGFRYTPRPNAYDDAFGPDGTPRPHQVELWRGLESLGGSEISKRWEQGRRLIRENGVTYNVYGDPRGMDRPWVLDPIPFVIAAEDWANLAHGLDQRARLLNALLADCYGKQEMLGERLLPPELMLGCPGFL